MPFFFLAFFFGDDDGVGDGGGDGVGGGTIGAVGSFLTAITPFDADDGFC